ncbi:MAG: iron donor protein CyaY [Rhodocyclaceae bacterium]|jgi:CyaY protein|nr:iron donor protein CyaY [Rhodocyclaceae bacterium]
MNEQDFNTLADAMLEEMEQALDRCAADFDYESKPGGVLELEFADGSKIIVNRHSAAREIWIAARSGGFHFKFDEGRWIGTRDGTELMQSLARCMSEQSGTKIKLD